MAPILFDLSAYSAVARSPVKTQLADALGAEVKEIIGCQAADIPYQYSMGRVRDVSVCLSFYSEVIQSSRCILMAKRLFGDFSVPPSISSRSYWPGSILENLSCKDTASPEAIVEPIGKVLWGLFDLSGFDPKRTFKIDC